MYYSTFSTESVTFSFLFTGVTGSGKSTANNFFSRRINFQLPVDFAQSQHAVSKNF